MKKLQFIGIALICALILSSCGGGASSGVKKNYTFGNLPKIYADYDLSRENFEKKYEAKADKLERGDKVKLMKLAEEADKEEDEIKEKHKADLEAETKKLDGKAIPFTMSDELKKSPALFYSIPELKFFINKSGDLAITCPITACKDFEVPKYKYSDYLVYYRFVGKENKNIVMASLYALESNYELVRITANQKLAEPALYLSIGRKNAADFADFEKIEFITQEEYKLYNR